MNLNLIDIEKELDEKFYSLSIWKLPFQTIISYLLLIADRLDQTGRPGIALDLLSRISLIYPTIKQHANKKHIQRTSTSLAEVKNKQHVEELSFLVAYAHFSMLMPQVHRGTLVVTKTEGNKIYLNYSNEEIIHSELIDKLYSYISLLMVLSYKDEDAFKKYLGTRKSTDNPFSNGLDFVWIKSIYEHYKKFTFDVRVLPSNAFADAVGVKFEDVYSFMAALRAFADFYTLQARSIKINEDNSETINQRLLATYQDLAVCVLDYKTLGLFMGISGLKREVFDKILSFFLEIYTNKTKEQFQSNSYCGDGYLPPIILIDKFIVFSPLAIKSFLNINNILYSINKTNKKLFDQKVSPHLEPALINQLNYIFSHINGVRIKNNILYNKSEVDMMVLSESEKTCIVIQVKTTIAPDSARTVERVQSRTMEAKKQIETFDSLENVEKLDIVNNSFKVSMDALKFINLIVVRSSAGSHKAWEINKQYRIVNYALISKVLCKKIQKKDHTIANIDKEILAEQSYILAKSDWSVKFGTIKLDKLEIECPDIDYIDENLISYNLDSLKCFKYYEKTDFD
ncbi:hypothetical protein [Cesiribacter sp. SM1]|uniref:hypothetical protein n=1 Tax=Cesiribacter sp. SM1 TaxID=2861196 RepID=UPI001CD2D901|nr:hypothetical protein [Cesiribacter sp. SM1]